AVVSVFVTLTSTPGNTAPEGSRTLPDIWEATVCPSTAGQSASMAANIATTLLIRTSTLFRVRNYLFRQSERDKCIRDWPSATDRCAAGSGDHDVLLTVFSHICGRRGMAAGRQLHRPQFSARFRVECAEPVVIRGGYKNQSARGSNASAEVLSSAFQSGLTQFGEGLIDAQRGRPGDLAFVDVNRHESAVRRRVTRDCGSTRKPVRKRARSAVSGSATTSAPAGATLRGGCCYSELSSSGRKRPGGPIRARIVHINENEPELRVV